MDPIATEVAADKRRVPIDVGKIERVMVVLVAVAISALLAAVTCAVLLRY